MPQRPDRAAAARRAFLEAEELPFPAQPLAETATVLLEELRHLARGLLARPVALQLADIGPGGGRNRAGLDHARHGHVVRLTARAAGRVGDEIDLVAIGQGRKDRQQQADFRPKAGHDQLLLSGLPNPIDNARIFPGVERGAVEGDLFGEDVLDLLDEILPFRECSGEQGRNAEDLRGLGHRLSIVDDLRRLVRAQRQKLEILVVDQQKCMIVRGQKVRSHCPSPSLGAGLARRGEGGLASSCRVAGDTGSSRPMNGTGSGSRSVFRLQCVSFGTLRLRQGSLQARGAALTHVFSAQCRRRRPKAVTSSILERSRPMSARR